MSDVTVGVDPHKKSVTIEAIDDQEKKLATGRFGTGNARKTDATDAHAIAAAAIRTPKLRVSA